MNDSVVAYLHGEKNFSWIQVLMIYMSKLLLTRNTDLRVTTRVF